MRHFDGQNGSCYLWRDNACWAHSVNQNMDFFTPRGGAEVLYESNDIVVLKWKLIEEWHHSNPTELLYYDANIRDTLSDKTRLNAYGIDLEKEVDRIRKERGNATLQRR